MEGVIVNPILAIYDIPAQDFPMMVLSDNLRSLFSFGIKAHEHGYYNHFMWALEPGVFASQDWIFHRVPFANYTKNHRLKFWYSPYWTAKDRTKLKQAIEKGLSEPWYSRLYDVPQVISYLWGGERWCQVPGIGICSSKVDYLTEVSQAWIPNRHLSPPELDEEFNNLLSYSVYGRYSVES
jgi:hypothetical protein